MYSIGKMILQAYDMQIDQRKNTYYFFSNRIKLSVLQNWTVTCCREENSYHKNVVFVRNVALFQILLEVMEFLNFLKRYIIVSNGTL